MADPSIKNPPAVATGPNVAAAPIHLPGGTTPRSALLIVFLVVFIDLLGFGIVLPLLPLIGDVYLADYFPGGKSSAQGGAVLGLLMSSFSLMQFIFAPIWGRVSDRIGRRPILLIGLAGSVVFYALFGFAAGMPQERAGLALTLLFAARIGQGIAGATIATAQAVIADCTTPEKRRHGMALIGAAFGIGFTFGPLIGAARSGSFPTIFRSPASTISRATPSPATRLRLFPPSRCCSGCGCCRRHAGTEWSRLFASASISAPCVRPWPTASPGR